MVTDAEIDAGIEAILAKDDTEIMMDELRNLFGADIDVDSRFTIAQVLTAMENSHKLAVEFCHIVERAKAAAAKRTRPTVDLGEDGELVARLRARPTISTQGLGTAFADPLTNEAADRLERYREAVAEARQALVDPEYYPQKLIDKLDAILSRG